MRVNTGGVVSTTVIFCMAVEVLIAWSMAVQVIGVFPRINCPTLLLKISINSGAEKSSVAVAVPISIKVTGPVASCVISGGVVMTGGVVSVPPIFDTNTSEIPVWVSI